MATRLTDTKELGTIGCNGAGLARFLEWKVNSPGPLNRNVIRLKVFMPVVAEHERKELLRRFGISDRVVEQSTDSSRHTLLDYRCKTPWYPYNGAGCPEGLPVVPIWECGDIITAVRGYPDGLEFIRYGIEWPDECERIAVTEQGMLAHLFVDLIEDNDEFQVDDFMDVADSIGFRFLATVFARYNAVPHDTSQDHSMFLASLASVIDDTDG